MYIIGQSYLLPTVRLSLKDGNIYDMVVIHEHVGDISGENHIHIDLRFFTKEMWAFAGDLLPTEILACDNFPSIVMKEMVCQSEYVPIKHFRGKIGRSGFFQIQKNNQDRCVVNNLCPHQGCDLSNIPATKINGKEAIVCPCHGLTWDAETGKMLKRMPRKNF